MVTCPRLMCHLLSESLPCTGFPGHDIMYGVFWTMEVLKTVLAPAEASCLLLPSLRACVSVSDFSPHQSSIRINGRPAYAMRVPSITSCYVGTVVSIFSATSWTGLVSKICGLESTCP